MLLDYFYAMGCQLLNRLENIYPCTTMFGFQTILNIFNQIGGATDNKIRVCTVIVCNSNKNRVGAFLVNLSSKTVI